MGRVAGGAAVGPILAEAIRGFEPVHPEKTIPLLVKARPAIAAISDPLGRIKLAELDETIARCAGIWAEAQARAPDVAPGTALSVTTTIVNRSNAEVKLAGARMEGMFSGEIPVKPSVLGYNQSATVEFSREVPAAEPYSQPYWLVKPLQGDVYTVEDQRLLGLADTPPAAQVRLRLEVGGAPVELVRPVHYRYADRAEGERTRPLAVVPAVAVNLPEAVAVFPSAAERAVHVTVQANVPKAAGELRLQLPAGWKCEPGVRQFDIAAAGEARELSFQVTPPAGETTATGHAVASVGGRDIAAGMETLVSALPGADLVSAFGHQ